MKLFDPEGPLMTALGKLADLALCNILFCLLSLPVVTMGAALTALYHCTMSIVQDREDPLIVKTFWNTFRRQFKQSTLLWLICLAIFALLAAYYAAVNMLTGQLATVYRITFFVLVFLFACGFQYLFPLLARYQLTPVQALKQAWLVSAAALPWTLGTLVITGGAVYLSFFLDPNGFSMALYLWAFLMVALVAYLNSFLLLAAFRRVIVTEEHPSKP